MFELELLRRHWREYLIEAALLGSFMVSACTFSVLLLHPSSPLVAGIGHPMVRQALLGLAMGGTALSIFYSPWGKRSGAHINPSVTLTFLRLGRVDPRDASFYALAQFTGGLSGVLLASAVLGTLVSHESVHFAVTKPGMYGIGAAFAAEILISFAMMTVVLVVSNSRFEHLTGVAAATLVATYITFEAPISGMSMNPARSFASALPAMHFADQWVYFVAPPLGMLLASEAFVRVRGRDGVACAKLRHTPNEPCIFCEYHRTRAGRAAVGESSPVTDAALATVRTTSTK